MAWKISVNVERDPEALTVVQGMIYAAAKAQGATDLEACSAALSLREAIQNHRRCARRAGAGRHAGLARPDRVGV